MQTWAMSHDTLLLYQLKQIACSFSCYERKYFWCISFLSIGFARVFLCLLDPGFRRKRFLVSSLIISNFIFNSSVTSSSCWSFTKMPRDACSLYCWYMFPSWIRNISLKLHIIFSCRSKWKPTLLDFQTNCVMFHQSDSNLGVLYDLFDLITLSKIHCLPLTNAIWRKVIPVILWKPLKNWQSRWRPELLFCIFCNIEASLIITWNSVVQLKLGIITFRNVFWKCNFNIRIFNVTIKTVDSFA